MLHDTTKFSYKRDDPEKIGLIGNVVAYQVCGLSMHSSLAVTTDGLPLSASLVILRHLY